MHALAQLPSWSSSWPRLSIRVLVTSLLWAPVAAAQSEDAPAAERPEDQPAPPEKVMPAEAGPGVAALFKDFLHYARLGKFQEARAFATRLLARPDLNPVELVEVADRDRKSVDTLITVINNSSIGEEAQRILEVLRQGEYLQRQDPQRIQVNIEKLAGPPQTEYNAIQGLIHSGEYAVPFMVQALTDPGRQAIWPRVLRALPQIGQPAVNPLVVALNVEDPALRKGLIRVLGEIGYPHAVPYLKKLLTVSELHQDTRAAIEEALGQIERRTGRRFQASAADEFVQLGEQYYEEQGSLQADPRLPSANVWYWREGFIDPVVVPQNIYGPVMAMRCAEEALRREPNREEAIALWLAANIRREARLGMDVESGEVSAESKDATRPTDFPRALYFSRAAGARQGLAVLDRANRDQDPAVALGAMAALRTVAGETALAGAHGHELPLVKALTFPDPVVRIKAALALAEARPKSPFPGAEWVVPVLGEALGQTGLEHFVVIDPDAANLNRVQEFLRQGGAQVLGAADFYTALDRTRREFRTVSGLFISTEIQSPGVRPALAELRREFLFKMTPVVLLRGTQEYETARDLAASDSRVALVDAAAEGTELSGAVQEVMSRSGRKTPDPEQALSLALQATEALLGLSVDGRTVLEVAVAEPALRSVLESAPDEGLRRKAAAVLALSRAGASQTALAGVALDNAQSETLRVAAFAALADSAKLNGNLLNETLLSRLVDVAAGEPNLTLRTAASQALGALNLKDNKAGEIIRKYHRG